MNRCLAMIFALFLTVLTVSSTCIAAPNEWVHFTLEPAHGGAGSALRNRIQLADIERGCGLFGCTGWCVLPSTSPLHGWLPNSAPFLDFSHLRS